MMLWHIVVDIYVKYSVMSFLLFPESEQVPEYQIRKDVENEYDCISWVNGFNFWSTIDTEVNHWQRRMSKTVVI